MNNKQRIMTLRLVVKLFHEFKEIQSHSEDICRLLCSVNDQGYIISKTNEIAKQAILESKSISDIMTDERKNVGPPTPTPTQAATTLCENLLRENRMLKLVLNDAATVLNNRDPGSFAALAESVGAWERKEPVGIEDLCK